MISYKILIKKLLVFLYFWRTVGPGCKKKLILIKNTKPCLAVIIFDCSAAHAFSATGILILAENSCLQSNILSCTPSPQEVEQGPQSPPAQEGGQGVRLHLTICVPGLFDSVHLESGTTFPSDLNYFIYTKIIERNWFFDTSSNFLNPISLQPYVVDLSFFKVLTLLIYIILV